MMNLHVWPRLGNYMRFFFICFINLIISKVLIYSYINIFILRIHGQKLAEMPLVATMFKYRGQGMCRVLLHELTKVIFGKFSL